MSPWNNSGIKINKLQDVGSIDSPQFSVVYNSLLRKSDSNPSYEILSLLKGGNDVVIEINSSIAMSGRKVDDSIYMNLIDNIRRLGLDYNYRKVESSEKPSFLSMIFGGARNETAHEIIAYIPDSVWKDASFFGILPQNGVRYYFLKNQENGEELIQKMSRMTDKEKLQYFQMVVFDVAAFGQMGIVSDYSSYEDIAALLKSLSK